MWEEGLLQTGLWDLTGGVVKMFQNCFMVMVVPPRKVTKNH
jgi:hypothetical protein